MDSRERRQAIQAHLASQCEMAELIVGADRMTAIAEASPTVELLSYRETAAVWNDLGRGLLNETVQYLPNGYRLYRFRADGSARVEDWGTKP